MAHTVCIQNHQNTKLMIEMPYSRVLKNYVKPFQHLLAKVLYSPPHQIELWANHISCPSEAVVHNILEKSFTENLNDYVPPKSIAHCNLETLKKSSEFIDIFYNKLL